MPNQAMHIRLLRAFVMCVVINFKMRDDTCLVWPLKPILSTSASICFQRRDSFFNSYSYCCIIFMDCIDKLVLTQTFILQLSLMIFMYLKLRVFLLKYIPRGFGALLCKHYFPVDVFSFLNKVSRNVGKKTSLLHMEIIILRNSTISIKIYL